MTPDAPSLANYPDTTDETLSVPSGEAIVEILHAHTTQLRTMPLLLQGVLRYMGSPPFPRSGAPLDEELSASLTRPMDLLRDSLQAIAGSAQQTSDISDLEFVNGTIRDAALNLLAFGANAPLMGELTRLRSLLEQFVYVANQGDLHSSLTFSVECARELLRILASADVLRLAAKLAELEEQTRQLRDVLLAGERQEEEARLVAFDTLVERSISQLRAYAESRRIDIRFHNRASRRDVLVQQTDVQRAVTSILANGVKYSYTLRGELRAWLDVAIGSGAKEVWLKVESWGVPVSRDEIEKGTIFLPGGRGNHAIQSGRLGSGIGLWDAKRVAVRHGGELELKSRPTAQKAYVTTATLLLPLAPLPSAVPRQKPVNAGQERSGRLQRVDSNWVVGLEGDDRLAMIENCNDLAPDLSEGTSVLVYVLHQSKRNGIRVRVIRIVGDSKC